VPNALGRLPAEQRRNKGRRRRRKTTHTPVNPALSMSGETIERKKINLLHVKSSVDSDEAPSKKRSILARAQEAWKMFSKEHRNLAIPVWYSGLYGVPNWFLRQKSSSKKMDEHAKAIVLIVRMNYILDHPRYFVPEAKPHTLLARSLRNFCRSHGHIFSDGSYQMITSGKRMNTSYARSPVYEWRSALACTLRNFVHLLAVKRELPIAGSHRVYDVLVSQTPSVVLDNDFSSAPPWDEAICA